MVHGLPGSFLSSARTLVTFVVVTAIAATVPDATHAAAGRTLGSFDVTSSGSTTYAIPLYAMPGPRGMQPAMALVYHSDGAGGILGKGWSLSGFDAISRCDKNVAQDGIAAAVQLQASDGYCHNGNRLLKTGGTYGADGSTYQTEMANFSQYRVVGTATGGPSSFLVRAKDGIDYEYGTDGNSRVLATGTSIAGTWMLREMRDRDNNRVKFTYAAPGSGLTGTTHPVLIEWTATSHGATTFKYSMSFEYVANVPESSYYGYAGGKAVSDDDLLDTITVRDGAAVVRKYKLDYGTSPTTGAKRLWRIRECSDAALSDCFEPSVFSYQDGQIGIAASGFSGAYSNDRDINGDGFPDALTKSGNIWQVTWGTQSGMNGTTVNVASSTGGAIAGDVRGVGQSDVLVVQGSVWWAYRWTGASFSGASTGISSADSAYLRLEDVNGDGRADMAYATSPGGAPGGMAYRASTSTAAAVSFNASLTPAFNVGDVSPCGECIQYSTIHDTGSFDYNGDGRVDFIVDYFGDHCYNIPECAGFYLFSGVQVLVSTPSGSYLPVPLWETGDTNLPSGIKVARINDDACWDVILQGTWDSTVIHSSCGLAAGQSFSVNGNIRAAVDWDADGRRDILYWAGGSTLSVRRSLGNGYGSPIATGIPNTTNCSWYTLDRNGDGLDDLGCRSFMSATYYLHNGSGSKPDLAVSFADGYGVSQVVSYVSATWGNHVKQSDAVSPVYDYQGPMQIVASVTHTDGIGGTYLLSYLYEGAARDRERRKHMGVASRKVTDSRDGSYRIDRYKRESPFGGVLWKSERYQPSGLLIYEDSTEFSLAYAGNAGTFMRPDIVYSKQYAVGGSLNGSLIVETGITLYWDSWGNVEQELTSVVDKDPGSPLFGSSYSKWVWADFAPDAGPNWCLNLPEQSFDYFSITGSDGSPYVQVTKQYAQHDFAKCRIPETSVDNAASPLQAKEVRTFDNFGNVATVTLTGRNPDLSFMAPRVHQIQWGAANGEVGGTGQFPVREIDALNKATTRTFHPTFGELATETDPNGIVVVSNQYDPFGRLKRVASADGTAVTIDRYDCSTLYCISGVKRIEKVALLDASGNLVRDDWTYLDQLDRPITGSTRLQSGEYDRRDITYDIFGRMATSGIPCLWAACSQHVVTNSYDAIGRLTQQSRPLSESDDESMVTTSITYNGLERVVTDGEGKFSKQRMDPLGRLRRSEDMNGYAQIFTYDAAGSLKKVEDSLENQLFIASYLYGIQAFQASTTDMDLGTRTYTYNSLGEMLSSTSAGQTVTFEYDAISRLRKRTESEGVTEWTWGDSAGAKNIGRMASVTSPGYSESFFYDGLGRLAQRSISSGITASVTYTYNNLGLLDVLTYPESTGSPLKVKYEYNSYGYLNAVRNWTSGSGAIYWQVNASNARNQITGESLNNGIVMTRVFDGVTGLVQHIQAGAGGGASLQNLSYGYDKVGNVIQRQDGNPPGLTENFYYDNLHRLDYSTLNGSTNLDLTYDPSLTGNMGNITSRWESGVGTTNWTYDGTRKHAVTSSGSASYSYDAKGRMTSRNGYAIDWTSYDYPKVVRAPGETAEFFYGPDRQYFKQIYSGPSGTETTHYVDDIFEQVQLPSGGYDWRHYVQADGRTVAIVSRTTSGEVVRYPVEDHQGSPATLFADSGGAVVEESFGAFGVPRNGATWSGSVPTGDLVAIESVSRRGFTGHTMIGRTGLIHMNGRVMDAAIGRFLSPDPYVTNPTSTQGLNRFAYVQNSPLTYIDPSGFDAEPPVGCFYVWHPSRDDFECHHVLDEIVAKYFLDHMGMLRFSLLNQPSYVNYRGAESDVDGQMEVLPEVVVRGKRVVGPTGLPQGRDPKSLVSALHDTGAVLLNATMLFDVSCDTPAFCTTLDLLLPSPGGKGKFVASHIDDVTRAATRLPANARTTIDPQEVYRRLERYNGIDPVKASDRLHEIKRSAGFGAADNVIFDLSGNVYDQAGNLIGSLTVGGR